MNKKICFLLAIAIALNISMINCFAGSLDEESTKRDKAYLAIVIDDFGNNSAGTQEMLNLPFPITAAVMPGLPSSAKDAEDFHRAGKGVILHMPMQSDTGKLSWVGKVALTTALTDEESEKRLNDALDELKYAKGINNHMGSTITRNPHIMDIVCKVAKERNLILLDSVTTPKTVVKQQAEKNNVKFLKRDVFLDGTKDKAKITKNLMQAAEVAKKNGYAIAIGHVGPWGGMPMAEVLATKGPELMKDGITFVTLEEMYKIANKDNRIF